MRLIRDKWMDRFVIHKKIVDRTGIPDPRKAKDQYDMYWDFEVSRSILTLSETIIFPTNIMLELLGTLDKIECRGEIHLPFPYLLIQFTESISEEIIMKHPEPSGLALIDSSKRDRVEGLLISNSRQDKSWERSKSTPEKFNSVSLFESTSLNRVAWVASELRTKPHFENPYPVPSRIQMENKQRLIELAYLISTFLNAKNVIVKDNIPDEKVQKKREKKGKAKLQTYHTVYIDTARVIYTNPKKGTGTPHSKVYPVRAHWRKLHKSEDRIWIPNHYRGLANAPLSVQTIYKVKEKKDGRSARE